MIDTQAIRSKILDLVIRGQLTEQLPEDGTAEELYQQIQIEKAKIVFERKGRKDNSILPVDEKTPFEIPEKWKWIRFGETGFFRKGPFGSSLTKSMFVPKSADTIKVYEQQHAIKKDHTLGTYYITKEYFDTSMKGFEVLSGDIIVSCAGTIGETYILPNNIERGIINQALMRITVVPSIDKQFFLYYFDSQLKKSAQDGNGSAITNIPPFDVLKNLYFPLPPLTEQKRIVEKIEQAFSILDIIDELQAQYADNLTALKSKLIDAAIQGKLTEQLLEDGTAEELYQQIQEEKQKLIKEGKIKKEKPYSKSPVLEPHPFDIPDNWKFVRFGELMINRDSERIPVSVADRRKKKKIYDYYGASGVIDGIDEYLFDEELLLIGEDGANLLARTRPVAFIAKGKYWVNNHAHVLDICCGVNLEYICYYINAISLQPYVTGMAQPKMNGMISCK